MRKTLLVWADKNVRDFPWRKEPTPFSILIAEVLLRRTTATAVLRMYPSFMEKYGDLNKIVEAEETAMATALSSIGYHRQRAKILKDISKFLVEKHNGIVPCSMDSLLQIPHVGSYTAGAILSLGCGQPSAMVDTNVNRIYARVFMSNLPKNSKSRQKRFIEEVATNCLPKLKHQTYNFALLDFAALICTYGIPRCRICPIKNLCDYFAEGLPSR